MRGNVPEKKAHHTPDHDLVLTTHRRRHGIAFFLHQDCRLISNGHTSHTIHTMHQHRAVRQACHLTPQLRILHGTPHSGRDLRTHPNAQELFKHIVVEPSPQERKRMNAYFANLACDLVYQYFCDVHLHTIIMFTCCFCMVCCMHMCCILAIRRHSVPRCQQIAHELLSTACTQGTRTRAAPR